VNKASEDTILQQLQKELHLEKANLNFVIGALIVVIAGILIFNYVKRGPDAEIGPAGKTETIEDVKVENLPGKYTVKEGDTLFDIAQKYYADGYKYSEISTTNKLENPDVLEVGQVLDIPKLEASAESTGTGGSTNLTIWGEKISGETYTVAEGDWLSTIAGRAYGDPTVYTQIVEANNIANPDVIEVGQTLKLPR